MWLGISFAFWNQITFGFFNDLCVRCGSILTAVVIISAQMHLDLVVNMHIWLTFICQESSLTLSLSQTTYLLISTDIKMRLSNRCVILWKRAALEVPLTRDIVSQRLSQGIESHQTCLFKEMQMVCAQKTMFWRIRRYKTMHCGLISNNSSQWLRLEGILLRAAFPQGVVIFKKGKLSCQAFARLRKSIVLLKPLKCSVRRLRTEMHGCCVGIVWSHTKSVNWPFMFVCAGRKHAHGVVSEPFLCLASDERVSQ